MDAVTQANQFHRHDQKVGLFHSGQMNANPLSVRVGHSERSIIGLTILAFHISPLTLGIFLSPGVLSFAM